MSQKNFNSGLLSDEEILDLYFARDEEAISYTDDKYGKYLRVIGYNILRDVYESEECTNDTYFSAWNKIPPHRPNLFQSFLSKIMRDISIMRYRKKNAAKRVPSELVSSLDELDECIPDVSTIDEELAIKGISEVLNTFLGEMDRRRRFIFVCRYFYCDKVKQIADMLGLSEKTVYRELEALRAEFKKRLDKEGIDI